MHDEDHRHPEPPRRFRRLRAWVSRRILGVDLRSELEAIHLAMSDAFVDLAGDLHDALTAQNRVAAEDLRERADLIAERADLIAGRIERKTEGISATLSRRIGALERAGRPMSDGAYAEFENRIRGPEPEVREKLRPLARHFRIAPVVDLGCGRGELLEEFRNACVPSYGVDSNKVMVATARAKGLRVLHEDLFDHLERLEAASLGGIAASHVVEHLTPPAVRHLLNEARRVLVPGGCLVLETPNPTSMWAYAQGWGRDPTHRWAPHPDTLAFMAERAGLAVVSILFTNPVPEQDRLKGADPDAERLNEFLYGPQDYVVVAERPLAERTEATTTAAATTPVAAAEPEATDVVAPDATGA